MSIRSAITGALSLAASAPQILDQIRSDGWQNSQTGFGTERDKTQGNFYALPSLLTDQELAALHSNNDLAAKTVDLPVIEAFREGFELTGIDDKGAAAKVADYVNGFNLNTICTEGAIWGRLFGGSAIWAMVDDGLDPVQPLDLALIRTVTGLKVIDRRWLIPHQWYQEGPQAGLPETFQVFVPRSGGVTQMIGYIHESRLVRFPGARTEYLEKLRRMQWDQSVLVKVYEALQATGNVWKAIEILTVDANQAVFSIKGIWKMIATDPTAGNQVNGGKRGGLLDRINFMDLMRSVGRAIVIDKDDESFERKTTSFAGLPELSEKQWTRVAAAADLPLPLLTGEYPSGLNSTGEGPFRVFYARVCADQKQIYEPILKQLLGILLAAADAPQVAGLSEPDDDRAPIQIGIKWNPLWQPNAIELAALRLQRAQEGDIWVAQQAMTPEENLLSTPEGWFPAVDRDALAQRAQDLGTADERAAEQADKDAEAAAEAAKAAPAMPGKPGGFPPKGKAQA